MSSSTRPPLPYRSWPGFRRNLDTVSPLFTLFVERSAPIVLLAPSLSLRTLADVNYHLRDDGSGSIRAGKPGRFSNVFL